MKEQIREFSCRSFVEESDLYKIRLGAEQYTSLELPSISEGQLVSHINIGSHDKGVIIGDYLLCWEDIENMKNSVGNK